MRRAERREGGARFSPGENSSTVLASQTVQVTTEANARPAMTAFTITSADRNMPHGDRSRGSAAAPRIGPPAGSASCAQAAHVNVRSNAAPSGTTAGRGRRPLRRRPLSWVRDFRVRISGLFG